MTYTILIFALVLVAFFFLIGSPIFAVLGGIAVLIFSYAGESLGLIAQDLFKLASKPSLLALPLFIFAGYYLAESTFAKRLLKLFESLAGWMRGGICLAAIVATDIFTAFTGASAITIVAFGGLIVPMLVREGYSGKFSEGLLTISGGSGALFPPCIAVILYGLIARTNIIWLFIAGFIPAVLFITAQYSYSLYVSIKEEIPTAPFSMHALTKAIRDLIWEIPLMALTVAGFLGGFITIDEAATITIVGFIVIEGFIHKEVAWKRLPFIMTESMMILGAIFLIMGCAIALTDYMVIKEVPQKVLQFIQGVVTSKFGFLMALNFFLLLVGMAMDMFSAIFVIVPLISPIAQNYGIDPLHLGVIFFLNLEIGFVTPPFGMSLFISSLRFKAPVLRIFRGVFPFFIMEAIALVIITYWEGISLWLLNLLNLKPLISIDML